MFFVKAEYYEWIAFQKIMIVNKVFVQIFTIFTGILVLASYVYGVSKSSDPVLLWGGVPLSWQSYIIPFMFVAAVGYVLYWWTVFFAIEESILESLTWPWAESDGNGARRLLLAYSLFLIPSALWLESTSFHIENDYAWTPILVVGMLILVSLGNILLGLLAYNSYRNDIDGGSYMLIGSIMISIQCIINDLLIWSYKFPWFD
ncbi:MAG: hypothetical protein ACI9O1_001182 [Candidatus Thalassarchaeaceae archaeon]